MDTGTNRVDWYHGKLELTRCRGRLTRPKFGAEVPHEIEEAERAA